MKKFIVPLLLAFTALFVIPSVTHQAHAQIVKAVTIPTVDTLLTNADTAWVTLSFDGSFKSVEAWAQEVSGTTGGKISFQGLLPHNGTSLTAVWVTLDSVALADVAEAQYKLFVVPSPRTYASYRIQYLKSGTGTARIKGFYVRYTGGAILRSDPYNGFAFLTSKSWRLLSDNMITENKRLSLGLRYSGQRE